MPIKPVIFLRPPTPDRQAFTSSSFPTIKPTAFLRFSLPVVCLALCDVGAPALRAQVNSTPPYINVQASAGAVTDTGVTNASMQYTSDGGLTTNSSVSGGGKPSTSNQQITDPGQYQFYGGASVADGVNPVNGSPYGVSATSHVSLPTGTIQLGATSRGGGASARGTLLETITFHNPSNGSVVVDVKLSLPGVLSRDPSNDNNISSLGGYFKFTTGSGLGNNGSFSVTDDKNGSQQTNTFGTSSGYAPTDIDLPANGVGGSVTIHIPLPSGDTAFDFEVDANVQANGATAAGAGAGLSPGLSFSMPAGVSYSSLSGALLTHPDFFGGEAPLTNGVYYLAFPDGNPFGYYSYLSDLHYIYHQDLGYEYLFKTNDGSGGLYLYDFKSNGFFYTSPTFPFPYLYDFSLNATLYYYPDPHNPGRYNTNGVRYFYNTATGQIISK